MYGAFHGRRFYHRSEDRILDRQHTSQAGKLEIPRNPGIGSNCRRCNPDPESDIRFHKRATRRSASQCNGGGYRAIDERLGRSWALYAIGAVLAIILNFCKIPALAFALGMFIPLELNTPLLIGGAISWYVGSRSKDQALNSVRLEKGTLLASGFIAGGALMGVVSAAMRFAGINLVDIKWMESNSAGVLAIVMYILLIAYLASSSLKAKEEK